MSLDQNDRVISQLTTSGIRRYFFDFPLEDISDVRVELNGVEVSRTDYSVSAANGYIEFNQVPVAGQRLVIYGNTPLIQEVIYSRAGNTLQLEALSRQLNRMTMGLQELSTKVNAAIGVSLPGPGVVLPDATGRAEKVLAFDNAGEPLMLPLQSSFDVVETTQIIDSTPESRQLIQTAGLPAMRSFLDVFGRGETYGRDVTDLIAGVLRRTALENRELAEDDPLIKRLLPLMAIWEPWEMSPDFTMWETQTGTRAQITEAVVRAWVRAEAARGMRGVWLKYVEIFGHWWTKPAFTRWDDRDAVPGALTPPKYWHEFPNNLSEFKADDFDFVAVVTDECSKNGMFVVLGVGRVGLFPTMVYYQTGTQGYTGPAALTQAAQMQLAADRTRLMVNDLATRLATYRDTILAFSSGFEPDHMPTWKVFSQLVTTGAGASPTVRALGYQWWATPGEMEEIPAVNANLATRIAFAQDLIDCGVDMWIWQDAVGPGLDFVSERNTYVSGVPLAQLDEYYWRIRRSQNDANAAGANAGRGIGMGTILEAWQMGSEPATNLTLSATSGATINVTSSLPFFLPFMNGLYITGGAAGNGRLSGIVSGNTLNALLDTTVAGTSRHAAGAAFGGTSLTQGNFSLNDGYTNPIPTSEARLLAQLAIHAKHSDVICAYGSSVFMADETLSVRLPQSKAGISDFRTRSSALRNAERNYRTSIMQRQRGTHKRLPRRDLVVGLDASPASSPFNQEGGYYAPTGANSVVRLMMKVHVRRGETATAFVNDITVALLVNNSVVRTAVVGSKNGVCGSTHELVFDVNNTGLAFSYALRVTWEGAAGNPILSNISWTVLEDLR